MPNPVSPIIQGFADQEIIYAKDQPQYKPLPVLKKADGVLLSRWRFTDEECAAITNGADIFLMNWTFNQPLQPVAIFVGEGGLAEFMGLHAIEPRMTTEEG
jgi:hypothetical protein